MITRSVAQLRSMTGMIEIYEEGAMLKIKSPYDQAFVMALKQSVPALDRRWDKPFWVVSKRYASELAQIVSDYYQVKLVLPDFDTSTEPDISVLFVEYIGYCKQRMGNLPSPSSYAFVNGSWSVLFPEVVLKLFFNAPGVTVQDDDNYYTILLIQQSATNDDIKKAFRRMSKQWHPDICKEPDAASNFRKINEANQVLSDPIKRKKYNGFLKIEQDAAARSPKSLIDDIYVNISYGNSYRPPLRCGMVTVELSKTASSRAVVNKIIAWDDIMDDQGRTMTSYWDRDAEMFIIEWV